MTYHGCRVDGLQVPSYVGVINTNWECLGTKYWGEYLELKGRSNRRMENMNNEKF
jgi:hypothetical protein